MQKHLSKALLAVSLSAGAAVSMPAHSATVLLDFSGNICGAAGNAVCTNFEQIGQNYGDTVGLDVSHRSTHLNGSTYEAFLKYWDSPSYSGLNDVAWGGADDANYRAEITFTALAGFSVSLDAVTFGSYRSVNRSLSFTVQDLGTNAVLFSSGSFNVAATPVNFAGNLSSNTGLVLTWGPDAYDVGVDDIRLTVSTLSVVPEPETYAMMLAGLGLLGFAARRRKQQAA